LWVKVKEKSPIVLQLGGKYDSDRRIQAYTELGHENIFGMGIRSNILARMGMRDGKIGVTILDDKIFTSNFTFSMQGYYSWEINPVGESDKVTGKYREDRKGVRLKVGRQVRRLGQLFAELKQENIEDRPFSGIFDNSLNIEIRTLSLHALSDKRDRIDFPTKGIYNHWAWESGNRFVLETEEAFTKALINLEGFYTLNSLHTWHLKFFVGIGDRTLPFSENFRIGGLHSFFGLHENQYFGRQVVTSSVEYRYRTPFKLGQGNLLFDDLYFLFRYDFGGIWDDPELVFTSDDFFSALGGALALDTFLGPFYLGYGRTTRGTDAGYISIGFNF
jgi:NTE family protein